MIIYNVAKPWHHAGTTEKNLLLRTHLNVYVPYNVTYFPLNLSLVYS